MIVVVGGAGYVGSVVVEHLVDRGYEVTVIDNFSLGHREAIPQSVDFKLTSMSDKSTIQNLADNFDIEVVMHFAAFAWVGESYEKPRKYWRQNVVRSVDMFEKWIEAGVKSFIFSSSAAVYGEPEYLPIDEAHAKSPINPYGRSKLSCEWYLEDLFRAGNVRSVSLRYFNAAGAGEQVGEDHDPETHLIPNLLKAAQEDEIFDLYGTDYDTRDGTCLRDFVHVKDLATAHVRALERIDALGCESINLGTKTGHTVREVAEMVRQVTEQDVRLNETDRRPGDPAKLVASNQKARELLDWVPERGLEEIIEDAWDWKQKHPDGYDS